MKLELTIDTVALWGRVTALLEKFTIVHLILIVFALHMIQIGYPVTGGDCSVAHGDWTTPINTPNGCQGLVFDETYVVKDANNFLQGIGTARLPLPSLIGAVGISIFGDQAFGWRVLPAVLQAGALFFFYLIAKRFLGDRWGLGATALLSMDTIWFIHGGLMLNDMSMFFFALAATEFYFRKRYYVSGALFGFALVSREMSLFWLATLGAYHLYANRKSLTPALKVGGKFLLAAGIISFGFLSAYDAVYHPQIAPGNVNVFVSLQYQVVTASGTTTTVSTITTPVSTVTSGAQELTNAIKHIQWVYQNIGPGTYFCAGGILNATNNTCTILYKSYKMPWAWILPFDIVPRNGTLQQSAFVSESYLTSFVQVSSNGVVTNSYSLHYYTYQPNLAVWYGFWPAIIAGFYAIFRKKEAEAGMFAVGGVLINYVPWLLLGIFDQTRIGFNFYFIYTLPFVAFGEAFAWKMLPPGIGRKVMIVNLIIAALFFFYFFPTRAIQTPG